MQVTLTASSKVISMPATINKSTCSYNMLDSTGCLCRWAIYVLPDACIATLLLYECCAFELVLRCACSVDMNCLAVLTLCNLLLMSSRLRQVTAWLGVVVSLPDCSLLAGLQHKM